MPSFSISQFTILPGPLQGSAEFFLLSTGPLLYFIICFVVVVHIYRLRFGGYNEKGSGVPEVPPSLENTRFSQIFAIILFCNHRLFTGGRFFC